MEKIIISQINNIILQLEELKNNLHPLQPNINISFVSDSSDTE